MVTKGRTTCLTNLQLLGTGLFKNVGPFVTTSIKRIKKFAI